MKYQSSWLTLLLVVVLALQTAAADEAESNVAKSRALVATFGSQLQAELKQSLGEGGPVGAIAVCYVSQLEDGTISYMSAIKTGTVCLVCHGDNLVDAISEKLEADYPHDLARGYGQGDIRGAFSLTWSAADVGSH